MSATSTNPKPYTYHSRVSSLGSTTDLLAGAGALPFTVETSSIFDQGKPVRRSYMHKPKTYRHAEVIIDRVSVRHLRTRSIPTILILDDFGKMTEAKTTNQSSQRMLTKCPSAIDLNLVSKKCLNRLSSFEQLGEMMELAETSPIKAYIKSSSQDFTRKLNSLKHLARINEIEANQAKKRRWQKNRFMHTKEQAEFTNQEITEIVGQWKREMKKFRF
jgi:hypothetical protein